MQDGGQINQTDNRTHIHLITFGSPAVANADTADILWDAIFTCTMYEMDGDPVPHLPPNFLGYQHLRQRTLIPLPNRGILTPDHPISGYIDAMKSMGA